MSSTIKLEITCPAERALDLAGPVSFWSALVALCLCVTSSVRSLDYEKRS